MSSFLKEKYLNEVIPLLQQEYNFKNKMSVPKLEKIIIHISLGEAKDNAGILDKVKVYLAALSGQMPVVTYAKKSVSSFKVTKGQPIGMMVTLRKERVYIFLEKLINVVLPKVRDFKGISQKAFDKSGNLNIGLKEQMIFPEVDYRTIDKVRGLAVTIVVNTNSKEQGRRFLELLGIPFQKGANNV